MNDNLNALDAAYRSLVLSTAGTHQDVRLRIMEATILGNTSKRFTHNDTPGACRNKDFVEPRHKRKRTLHTRFRARRASYVV